MNVNNQSSYNINIEAEIEELMHSPYLPILIADRVNKCMLADPDPYCLHNLTLEHRLSCIQHFIITGKFIL